LELLQTEQTPATLDIISLFRGLEMKNFYNLLINIILMPACGFLRLRGCAMKRHKTDYPGVFYREAERIGGKGLERVYYIVFKLDGKVFEEKAGRQFKDNMTPARAARIRGERIEGRRQSRKEIREAAAEIKWTVDRLRNKYNAGWRTDRGRYENHLKSALGGKLRTSPPWRINVIRDRAGLPKDFRPLR
jgi:hypothetical protein